MTSGGIWAKVHKWLALVMAIQILFWFASGLFFAWFPIERVRSEHAMAAAAPAPVPLAEAEAGLARLRTAGLGQAATIEIRRVDGRPAALVGGQRPVLYDLATARRLSPIPLTLAARIAEADHAGDLRAARVTRIAENDSEYRGALPAWRVDFEDGEGRAIYVAADTGAVTARRSTLWRAYDFLWGLHIMDWRGHANFNSWLLVIATGLGLVVIVTGIIMMPSRLGLTAWLRRRKARRLSGLRTRAAAPPG
ncbi:MAG TPA: PepSY domain-containing protein [Allosphingosinicella sp.]|nr:PepSY domain-containing protein [Allosphingosinicella sp.]